MKTYKTIINDKNGDSVTRTFDVNDNDIVTTVVKSEKEAENHDKFVKNKKRLDAEMKEFIENNEGAFVHLIFKYGQPIFSKLEEKVPGNKANIHEISFIMLAAHMTFKGNLSDSNGRRIKKSSLGKIWGTSSKNSINETYNVLKECGYIYETEEGYIMINEDIIIKGAVENFKELKREDNDYTYTRVFVDNVKEMYYGTESRKRKQLANLFKILPYINFKYNVFCMNPKEVDETKLELLSWKQLAELCGYDKTQVARFKKDLWNLKIYDHCVIGEFHCEAGMAICVNPKVYYGGDDVNDVRNLYVMFKMCEKK